MVIRRVTALGPAEIAGLAQVLADCVDGGASVNFMSPFTAAQAATFWAGQAAEVAAGTRLLYVAEIAGRIVGTVQVVKASQPNQPHRGDLAKMLVHRAARGAGVGAALRPAAQAGAQEAGLTLLTLDTASDAAERLYTRMGWVRVGSVPDYALLPQGGFCDSIFYYLKL